jgi:hypothetical protein
VTVHKPIPDQSEKVGPAESPAADAADEALLREARARYEKGQMNFVSLEEAKAELGL